ncbi:MAG TPA: HAD hydrolase family protein [Candidatus Acidoferrum sp.]|nr:HAD hydrolase family protein [Candidatus Acidoferrum sp.]
MKGPQLHSRLANIRLFLCDVDGVLTDGSIYIGDRREVKRFSIHDGLGLVLLRRAGIKTGWVSSRPSPATTLRARELKIIFLVQQNDRLSKAGAIEKILKREKMDWDDVCYMGDDIVDLAPLAKAGVGVAVANAVGEARAAADYVTRAAGGCGAVREVVEMILKAQGKWDAMIAGYRK